MEKITKKLSLKFNEFYKTILRQKINKPWNFGKS